MSTTPNMTPEQLKELKQLEGRLKKHNAEAARTRRDTLKKLRDLTTSSEAKAIAANLKLAKQADSQFAKRVAAARKAFQRSEEKILQGLTVAGAEIERRIHVLQGRLSS